MNRTYLSQFPWLSMATLALTLTWASSAFAAGKYTVIHTFSGGKDGGNLYGTTGVGGADGYGTIFLLSPVAGSWQLTVAHTFTGGKDGGSPRAGLMIDGAGKIYGSAIGGGSAGCSNQQGCGVLFQLSPF